MKLARTLRVPGALSGRGSFVSRPVGRINPFGRLFLRAVRQVWLWAGVAAAVGCVAVSPDRTGTRELGEWNPGPARQAIVAFVRRVTDPQGPDHVPAKDRIAVFDHDGTLWLEKPRYIPVEFQLAAIRARVRKDPRLGRTQPYKAFLEDDKAYLESLGWKRRIDFLFNLHQDLSAAGYREQVRAFLAAYRHPRFGAPARALTYAPMVELVHYLRRHGFKVYIVTGGELDFVRALSEEFYNIPAENVVGSFVRYAYRRNGDGGRIIRGRLLSFNIRAEKPANIQLFIGKRPILAFGNSDGDMEMLRYTAESGGPALSLLLHHDDGDRAYAYDRGAEQALALAKQKGWTVVSMKKDFRRVFRLPPRERETVRSYPVSRAAE